MDRKPGRDSCSPILVQISSGYSFWSYNEENCQDDPAWCFGNTVGKSLPSSFSAYPEAPARSVSRSKAKPSDSIPTISEPLLSAINALTPPPLNRAPESAVNGTKQNVNTIEDIPVTPESASDAGTKAVKSNAGALGLVKRFASWARHRSDHFASKKRANDKASPAVHPRNFKLASGPSSSSASPSKHRSMQKRGASSSEQAISLGYSEGFDTGRAFAANNLSKVGFIFQLIEDKLVEHVANKDVDESKGDYYRSWFAKGVADAEALVVSLHALLALHARRADD